MESLALAIAGGAAGLLLAVWMDKALMAFLPQGAIPMVISSTPDWRILTFNLGVSLLTGIIFGLVPALQSTRSPCRGDVEGSGRVHRGRNGRRAAKGAGGGPGDAVPAAADRRGICSSGA